MLFSHFDILKMANRQKKSNSNIGEYIGCVMTNESNDTESDIDLGQSDYDREKVQIHTYLFMNQKVLQMSLIYIKKLRHCCYWKFW